MIQIQANLDSPKKVLEIGNYSILIFLCTPTQSLLSVKVFLLEEGLFLHGYFWREEKVQSICIPH